jgi:hypothetical protein
MPSNWKAARNFPFRPFFRIQRKSWFKKNRASLLKTWVLGNTWVSGLRNGEYAGVFEAADRLSELHYNPVSLKLE